MKEFAHWLSIATKPGYSGAAVYEFRASVDEKPAPLGRALGIDTNGTPVFGSSGCLPARGLAQGPDPSLFD
jgi:hypothetical protein